jgi:hypothetical protein
MTRRFGHTVAGLKSIAAIGLLTVGFSIVPAASALPSVYSGDCLPPPASQLRAAATLQYQTSLGTVELSDLVLSSFATPCERLPRAGSTDTKTFDALLVANLSVAGGAPVDATTTAKLTQSVTGTSKGGKNRAFDLELLALSPVLLPLDVRLREGPTLSSKGTAMVGKAPKGGSSVDAYLDVYTEVSVDGGVTWAPSVDGAGNPSSMRLTYEPGV